MKKRIITLLAILAVMVACVVFAVQATETEPVTTQNAWEKFECPCPSCKNQAGVATWSAMTAGSGVSNGGHYYVTGDVERTSAISANEKTIVIFIDGGSLTLSGNRGITMTKAAFVYLVGNNGAAMYTKPTTQDGIAQLGGLGGVPELHFYGDLTVKMKEGHTATTGAGLVKISTGKVYVHDFGTDESLTSDTDPTFYGLPCASTSNGSVFWAQSGGTDYISIEAGTFYSASAGPAIKVEGGTCDISGGTFNGHDTAYALRTSNGTTNISGGTFNAVGYSAVYPGGGRVNISGGTFNASAAGRGVYTNSGTTLITGGTFNGDGVVGLRVAGGLCAVTGGTFVGGADTGAIEISSGTLVIDGTPTLTKGTNANGELVRTDGALLFTVAWCDNDSTSATVVSDGTTLNNMGGYIAGNTEGADDTSLASIDHGTLTITDSEVTFTRTGNAGTNVNGVTHETGLTFYRPDHYNPPLYRYASTDDGSGFTTPRGQLVINGETAAWAARTQDLFDDYASSKATNKFVRVWGWQPTTVNYDVCVDFNGRTGTSAWTINSGKTLYAFDSKATLETAGVTLPITGSGTPSPITVAPNGKIYAIAENTIYEVGVSADINQVALRPACAGMYFGAKTTVTGLDAGKAVAEANLFTGVAVSTEQNKAFDETQWTAEKGTTGNGILVMNVLKDGEDNAKRSNIPVYAKACVTYGGKLVALGAEKPLSMTGLMEKMDTAWANDKLDATQKQNLLGFYDAWSEICGWTYANIKAE